MENLGFKENVLITLSQWLAGKTPSALATLVDIDGSSSRPLGSQMAINSKGQYIGQITGGCGENAIIHIAQEVIHERVDRIVRFGKGSPYLDITLPCGTSIDVLFSYQEKSATIDTLVTGLKNREIQTMTLGLTDFTFHKQLAPPVQLIAMGAGPLTLELLKQAEHLEFDTLAVCDDESTQDLVQAAGFSFTTTNSFDLNKIDSLSAVAILHHDHEKELPLWRKVLDSPAFYLGALGSQKTHEQRKKNLQTAGFSDSQIQRIHGPIGLAIKAKSPPTIAITILAEILVEKANHEAQ